MPGRGGWKTILKYAAGIFALSASVAVAWFLPGLYAGWQDARTEGHVVLSERENIRFLDTASLDIAGRLQMLQETEDFSWEWGYTKGMEEPLEEMVARCFDAMEDWCGAGLFPEGCLAGIVSENLYLADIATVRLADATLPVYCFRFYDVEGYAVTLITDANVDMIYYASVTGPSMLDVIAADLGFESFVALGAHELELLNEQGFTPQQLLEGDADETIEDFYAYVAENVRPLEESRYDFAAVCGAQGAVVSRAPDRLSLDAELSFEAFTGHAYRLLAGTDYNMDPDRSGIGFAVMYGTQSWKELASDFSGMYGSWEEFADDASELYGLALNYMIGDTDVMDELNYPPAEAAQMAEESMAQGLSRSVASSATQDLYGDGYGGAEPEKQRP